MLAIAFFIEGSKMWKKTSTFPLRSIGLKNYYIYYIHQGGYPSRAATNRFSLSWSLLENDKWLPIRNVVNFTFAWSVQVKKNLPLFWKCVETKFFVVYPRYWISTTGSNVSSKYDEWCFFFFFFSWQEIKFGMKMGVLWWV